MPNRKNGKSSADYYKESPESRAKKNAYQKKYNATPEARKKRGELVKINRTAQKNGTGKKNDGKDYDHATGRMVSASTNRGRTGKNGSPATAGDKKSRSAGRKYK